MSWPNSDATEGDGLRGNGEERLCEHGMREDKNGRFVRPFARTEPKRIRKFDIFPS